MSCRHLSWLFIVLAIFCQSSCGNSSHSAQLSDESTPSSPKLVQDVKVESITPVQQSIIPEVTSLTASPVDHPVTVMTTNKPVTENVSGSENTRSRGAHTEIALVNNVAPVGTDSKLPLTDADWSCWRGPLHDGTVVNAKLPTEWSLTNNVVWKSPIAGRGHASPIVVQDKVIISTADDARQIQSLICYDFNTGKQLWKTDLYKGGFEPPEKMYVTNSHASGTPISDGTHIYVPYLNHQKINVACVDLNGKEKWKSVVSPYNSLFGFGTSLVMYGPYVIMPADHSSGACIAALERSTGKIAWKKPRPSYPSYETPRLLTLDNQPHLLLSGCTKLISYNPMTGDEQFVLDGVTETHIGTIVAEKNHFALSGGYPKTETIGYEFANGACREVWRNNVKIYIPSMAVYQGHIYAVSDDGKAYCWNLKDGQQKWVRRVGGKFSASPIVSGDTMYITAEKGPTMLMKLSPEKYELIAENPMGDEIYASPAVSKNQLLMRTAIMEKGNRQEYLYRIGQ
jgi:hypothetical protein